VKDFPSWAEDQVPVETQVITWNNVRANLLASKTVRDKYDFAVSFHQFATGQEYHGQMIDFVPREEEGFL
jgi:hypothetical protein